MSSTDDASPDPLLSVRNLRTQFPTREGTVRAVDGVSFDVRRGETVCLVGESGSGKTVTCESITELVPAPGEIVGGRVTFDGVDLTDRTPDQLREVRGDRIAHVFQNPGDALDPMYTVGEQIAEAIQFHREVPEGAARERALDLLDRVGIPNAVERVDDYPHQFSGGMKQRVVIAVALANDPDLLVADEPTTALDATIEAQILDLLAELQAERGMAMLFVTHDLDVVGDVADRVVVMYAGKVMERGDVRDVFGSPAHPYTDALFDCLPGRGDGLDPIGGTAPDVTDPPAGCRFHPRCRHAVEACGGGDQPPLHAVGEDHRAACIFRDPDRDDGELDDTDTSEDAERVGDADALGDEEGSA